MRTSSIVATVAALFAASTVAAPAANAEAAPKKGWRGGRPFEPPSCMSDADANITADNFRQLIQGYTKEMALAALTEDFVDYTSAVSVIINKGGSAPKDLTVPIFTNRNQFMEGHGKQKPIPFETTHVWHNCNGTVSMRWISRRSAFQQPIEAAAIPVVGTAILETVPAEEGNQYKYRIKTLFSEFNTAAWLVNNGVFKTAPNVTIQAPPAGKREVAEGAVAGADIEHWSDVGMI